MHTYKPEEKMRAVFYDLSGSLWLFIGACISVKNTTPEHSGSAAHRGQHSDVCAHTHACADTQREKTGGHSPRAFNSTVLKHSLHTHTAS